MEKNITEAKNALENKPLLSATAERILILNEIKDKNKELPQPLRFSAMMSELLERVSTPIEDHDIIVGRALDRELTEDEERLFFEFLKSKDYPRKTVIFGMGHLSYDWEDIVELGLCGLKERAQKSLHAQTDPKKQTFVQAAIEVYEAIKRYILRYAEAAKSKGMTALYENLTSCANEKPKSFYAALQLLWIITLIECSYVTPNPTLTLGRLDRILYPLYKKDIESGALTEDEARKYITDYYCKHNLNMGRGEHQVGDKSNATTFDRIFNFDAPQYLLLGGTDENGKSAVNDLTQLFAECIRPSFKNPVVVVRYYTEMNKEHPKLWSTLCEKALASASLMFYNDANVISTYKRLGIPESDCRSYYHFGCNWAAPCPDSAWMQGGPRSKHFNSYLTEEEKAEFENKPYMRSNTPHGWPEDLMEVLRELSKREDGGLTVEDVYKGFFDRMGDFIDRKLESLAHELEIRRRNPSAVITFADCFYKRSIANAECFAAGAKYHFEFQAFQMFGTVADCFITLDKLVFTDKKIGLSALTGAIEADFEGYEDVLALCKSVPKYGSDTEYTNAHARRLASTAAELIVEKSRPYLEKYGLFLEPCMQSDTWHLKFGETFGATPDGRRAGTSFSQNSRPSNGSCTSGITGMLNSMLSIPPDSLVSGALNLDLRPSEFEGEQGRARFSALLSSYFNRGGMHAQVSCVSREDLIDAQINPEKHRDLRVRVTGYSGVFVDICKRLQSDIIERMN